jgi:membrane-associated phospholipid phosphatase
VDVVLTRAAKSDRREQRRTEVLLLVSALVVLAVSAVPAQGNTASAAERTVFRWINDLPGFLYGPAAVIMQFGNVVAVVALAAVAIVFRRYRLAFGLALAGLAAYFGARVIKRLVDRGRPTDLLADVRERGAHAGGLGYVSGHAAVAFATVTVVTMWLPRPARIALWTLAVAVAVARVYVGAHLPLDVLGGAAFGIACGSAARLVIGARRHGRQAEQGVACHDTAAL